MYSARITRLNPTAFIILIDQSGSMSEKVCFNSQMMTKAEAVALVTNMMISELTYRCQREVGIANYFDIAAFGYSDNNVESLLDSKNPFLKPSELLSLNRKKITITKERSLPSGDTVIASSDQVCWIEPKAHGSTPMCTALLKAYHLAAQWCANVSNKKSYPLTIFNITDGEASDGNYDDLIAVSDNIKSLHTDDGNVLLINIHICSGDSLRETNIIFPCSTEEVPDTKYAHLLYNMSSVMPEEYNEHISEVRSKLSNPPYKGMSFNTSVTDLISMMNIGSMSVTII